MKTALVHDWLITLGGAEKVLESMWELFPSPIYTLFHDKKNMEKGFFTKKQITSSFLQKIPGSLSFYRHLLPLFPKAIESFDLSAYEVILSSSHSVAKAVLKKPDQLHICYCHTPMRYVWDLQDVYLNSFGFLLKNIARPFFNRLRHWDQKTAHSVDLFIANSSYVAERIAKSYQRKASVIYPPVSVENFYLSQKKEDYYITHGRLVPYKRIDFLVKAFAKMPEKKLVIIGTGPEEKKIRSIATKNVEFLGYVEREKLSKLLSQAKAYVFAAEEDFGISVVEAQASGLPVIALGKGGALETVLDGKTGLFFKEPLESLFIEAIKSFEKTEAIFDPIFIRSHASFFHKARFEIEFQQCVKQAKERFFS